MNTINFPTFLILWNKLQRQGTPNVHLRLASWIEQRWIQGDRRLLVMAFRSCGKSTIVGIFCTWLLWRNQDLRILVLAADLALARKMVRNVKRIIEKHPLTKSLKPERLDQWGSDRFTLKRSLELRDPSMLAKGISTNLTGTRADLIICDDVEVPKTCDTSGKREEMRTRLAELEYILTPQGTQIYVGTPHHWNTIYADEKREGESEIFLEGFERIVIPILDKDGNSAWPERYSLETIDKIHMKNGPSQFASQMMCQPSNLTDGKFDPALLNMYEEDVVYTEAARESILTIQGKKMVHAVAYWDPAFGKVGGDKSIIAIVYIDEAGHYWLHHLQAILTKPDGSTSEAQQQVEAVTKLMIDYFIPVVAIENNGIGMFLPSMLRNELAFQNAGCTMVEINNRKPKNIRILQALESTLAARALNVHRTALHNSFLQELRDWSPAKKNQADDALDAVSGAITLTPVRIQRIFSTAKRSPLSRAKVSIAKTVLD